MTMFSLSNPAPARLSEDRSPTHTRRRLFIGCHGRHRPALSIHATSESANSNDDATVASHWSDVATDPAHHSASSTSSVQPRDVLQVRLT